ncbi:MULTISPECIES: PilN domain-containing protein [unclassified Massilia]|uniref:PilN domain-containing protein n=1 Tax=unclassified Massilia TaxID=2609279 RepID=UPI00177B23F2|nr:MULTISPECIES: PilN domain-containing protein [unclassified Massilia]MBD8531740.1 PilN domain-containing protein [Massilia sp. CFBP 13647]MBD8675185.1 PilN domain-containing protein [Massilia sp. CFBP 13721]
MADIDMIPRSYREGVRVRRTLTVYGSALALLLVAGGGASALLHWRLSLETPRLEQSRTASGQASTLRTQLIDAQARKDLLADNVAALAALRGSGEVAALAASVDAAIDAKVWFEGLRFSRSQELLQAPPPAPLPAGVVQARVAAGSPQTGAVQAWRLGSQIEIDGQAVDTDAMTRFLAALAADPALADVRFLNSSTAPALEGGAVQFKATAALVKRGKRP